MVGERGRDDDWVERAQEHGQHDAGQDAANRSVVERRRWCRGGAHTDDNRAEAVVTTRC
jgi:hypothetical protein